MSKSKRVGPAARQNKGHPRREARRLRAAERLAAHVCGPTCKRNRKAVPQLPEKATPWNTEPPSTD